MQAPHFAVQNLTLLQAAFAFRRRQWRETGRYIAEFDALRAVAAMSPCELAAEIREPGREYDGLRFYLAVEQYDHSAIEGATYDAVRCGTLAESLWIDDADRDAVEELLPNAVALAV